MRSFVKYLIAALPLIALAGGCSGTASDPAEVVAAFTRAVAAGRFDEASGLCSTSMQAYVEAFAEALDKESASDSTAAAIATGILSEMTVTVNRTEASRDIRMVFYTIEDAYGHRKEKVACLRKEEGEWKVTEISDRN